MTSKEQSPIARPKHATKPDIGRLTPLTAIMNEATLKLNENSGSSSSSVGDFKTNSADGVKEKENSLYNIEWPLNVSETKQEKLEKSRKHEMGSHRFQIALLGLTIAAVNCYAQATFCIAIVEMVLPTDFVIKTNETTQSVVIRVIPQLDGAPTSVSINVPDTPVLFEDHSCPVEYKYRDYYDSWRFLSNENASAPVSTIAQSSTSHLIDMSDRFDWDASHQGLLLGAFAIGTAPLQVLGGRLAEIYGAKWVLLAGCIGTALTNLTIPLIARFSFILLLINRVSMGIAQAGMEPGLMCLLAEWLTPAETGFFISMLLFAICIGFFLGSLCSSFILTIGYGWPLTYYVAGGLNLIVGLVWLIYASSRPSESSLITVKELAYIEGSKQQVIANNNNNNNNKELDGNNDLNLNISSSSPSDAFANKPSAAATDNKVDNKQQVMQRPVIGVEQAPWMNILRTPSVWAFIICKISIRWAADVLGIELPSYLANVLHLSIKLNGILNSVSSALFAIFSFLTGYLANEILRNQIKASKKQYDDDDHHEHHNERRSYIRTISKTNLRKMIQSCASFGSAICMCLMTRYDCNILFSMSMLLVLSCCLVMGTGGELQIPYDMTSKYPGTVHGLACTMSVSGWLAPPLIGLILGDQPSSRYRWNIVWYLTASINLIGGLVFVLFADASPRDFDRRPPRKLGGNANEEGEERVSSLVDKDEQYATDDERGRHTNLDGYYNAACRSSADGSPTTVERCLHATTCDGSPATLPFLTVELGRDDCFANEQQQKRRQQELNWKSHFDRDLIKCRQVEESFIVKAAFNQSGYLHHQLDSLATQPIIFPYRAKSVTSAGEHLPLADANRKALSASSTNYKQAAKEQLGQQRGLVRRLVRQLGGQSRKKFSLGGRKRVAPLQKDDAMLEDKRPHENQRADVLPHNVVYPPAVANNDNLVERDANQQLAGAAFARGTSRIVMPTPTTAKTITHL